MLEEEGQELRLAGTAHLGKHGERAEETLRHYWNILVRLYVVPKLARAS